MYESKIFGHGLWGLVKIVCIHLLPITSFIWFVISERENRRLWDWQDLKRGSNQGPSNAQRWKAEKCDERQKEKRPLTRKAREIMPCCPASVMAWLCNSSVWREFFNEMWNEMNFIYLALIMVHNYNTWT